MSTYIIKNPGLSRFGLYFLIILVVLITGGITYFFMDTTDKEVPSVTLTANGEVIPVESYSWRVPVLGGLFYREFKEVGSGGPYNVGEVHQSHVDVSTPERFDVSILVTDQEGTAVFEGNKSQYDLFRLSENGTYEYKVKAIIPKRSKENYGEFQFSFITNLVLDPKVFTSETKVVQGDVLSIQVTDVPKDIVPVATSDLGLSVFTQSDGVFKASVPVGYLKSTGKYQVTVTIGDVVKTIDVEVIAGNFEKQYLTINTSNPVISEASSPKAYEQYRETIYPLFETADSDTYWNGSFTQPVQGRISTEFGLLRYTNGSKTPSGHSGIDIAAAKGTPVIAPASGRVVYADYLLNTGNTLVIEHGGGLKSYFYHMNSLSVKQGDMVKQGQNVGEVGNTGYSTGAHLHYEVRIGNQALNPWNLFNGTGGFFSLI